MAIVALDLGNVQFYEGLPCTNPKWTSIDISGPQDKGKVQGDFFRMPFANNTFDLVKGFCYLEELAEWQELLELYRILKPGGIAYLGACSSFYRHDRKWQAWLTEAMTRSCEQMEYFTKAGFKLVSAQCGYEAQEDDIPLPRFVLRKPKGD